MGNPYKFPQYYAESMLFAQVEAIVCQCLAIWRSKSQSVFIFKCSCSKRIVEGDKTHYTHFYWLTGWRTDCLIGLTGWLTDWLTGCCLTDCTVLTNWLADWLTDLLLLTWLTHSFTHSLSASLSLTHLSCTMSKPFAHLLSPSQPPRWPPQVMAACKTPRFQWFTH